MIETKTPPANTELDEEIANFVMPPITPGAQVLYYRNGLADKTTVEIAYMLRSNNRSSSVFALMTNRRMDAVRHVSDPKLKLNADQRENGAWDYTDEYRETMRIRQDIEDRLSAIERKVNLLTYEKNPVPEVKNSAQSMRGKLAAARLKAYRELSERAKSMGIAVVPGMTKAQLEAAIEQASAPEAVQ